MSIWCKTTVVRYIQSMKAAKFSIANKQFGTFPFEHPCTQELSYLACSKKFFLIIRIRTDEKVQEKVRHLTVSPTGSQGILRVITFSIGSYIFKMQQKVFTHYKMIDWLTPLLWLMPISLPECVKLQYAFRVKLECRYTATSIHQILTHKGHKGTNAVIPEVCLWIRQLWCLPELTVADSRVSHMSSLRTLQPPRFD